jgi:hypothetical protein
MAFFQANYAKVRVTSRYLDHVAPEELIEAQGQRRWTAT